MTNEQYEIFKKFIEMQGVLLFTDNEAVKLKIFEVLYEVRSQLKHFNGDLNKISELRDMVRELMRI